MFCYHIKKQSKFNEVKSLHFPYTIGRIHIMEIEYMLQHRDNIDLSLLRNHCSIHFLCNKMYCRISNVTCQMQGHTISFDEVGR